MAFKEEVFLNPEDCRQLLESMSPRTITPGQNKIPGGCTSLVPVDLKGNEQYFVILMCPEIPGKGKTGDRIAPRFQ